MKIQSTNAQTPSPVDRTTRGKRGEGAPSRSDGSASRVGERTTVSEGARTLAAHARSPEKPDDIRIARIKAEIARGSFRIDFDRIAEAMMREER